jgi:ribosomal protein L30/L7E
VDVLVIQGTDAGGHQWAQGASLISLLPEVRDLLSSAQNTTTAILAAGGIVDERGCVAALGLGRLFHTSLLQLIDKYRCRWYCHGHKGKSFFLYIWILLIGSSSWQRRNVLRRLRLNRPLYR